MRADYYAHSLPKEPIQKWERLEDHLQAVATRARDFAAKFDAGDWGYLAGLWHDLGKYSNEFQAYLKTENGFEAHLEGEQYVGRVDHSTAGAQHANAVAGEAARILAYCITGHHGGLLDADSRTADKPGLAERLKKEICSTAAAPEHITAFRGISAPKLTLAPRDANRSAFQIALFCRLLFSSLVDADFLATERFMSPAQAALRPSRSAVSADMQLALDLHLAELAKHTARGTVNDCRQEVLAACQAAADLPPGLFSLTVPTGGGKTLAALSFALRHAARHQFERTIFAIPFTSIIEQTADVYRGVFRDLGADMVLEHHSNLDPDRETVQSRMAAENWDAPLVVTTNVQFFESLFACETSRCRKLHRIARSIVILDEAQTLPVGLLEPCLAALRALALDYHCSIVLCTATQPAIEQRDDFRIGLENVRPIIHQPEALYTRMNRVRVHQLGQLADDDLVQRIAESPRILCIVNTRPHAARLFEKLTEALPVAEREGAFHLSTRMCGQHRSKILVELRERLVRGDRCRVISTQLVEAGVDIDFPVVYRALAGVDSIAQAAGRCNREGRQAVGDFFVFQPADVRLRGYLDSTAKSTAELLPEFDDLLSLEAVRRYFEIHYWKHSDQWDSKGILDLFRNPGQQVFQFREASRLFRMIDDDSQPLIVPWKEEGLRLAAIVSRGEPLDWKTRRALQRYVVPVLQKDLQALAGDIDARNESHPLLINRECYDDKLGLRIDRAGYHEPESLISC